MTFDDSPRCKKGFTLLGEMKAFVKDWNFLYFEINDLYIFFFLLFFWQQQYGYLAISLSSPIASVPNKYPHVSFFYKFVDNIIVSLLFLVYIWSERFSHKQIIKMGFQETSVCTMRQLFQQIFWTSGATTQEHKRGKMDQRWNGYDQIML